MVRGIRVDARCMSHRLAVGAVNIVEFLVIYLILDVRTACPAVSSTANQFRATSRELRDRCSGPLLVFDARDRR